VKATARIVALADGRGGTRCTTLRSAPPLSFRETAEGLYLVGTAAGPLGGDDLRLGLSVGAGAALTVRSAAAMLVQPGARPGAPSSLHVDVEVGPGGLLRWLPEPTVAVRGCDHRATTVIRLAPGAQLVWREELVLGRHGEEGGSILQRLRIDAGGLALLRNDLAAGPRWPGSSGPAVTAGARALGALVTVGGAEAPDPAGTEADASVPSAPGFREPGGPRPPAARSVTVPLVAGTTTGTLTTALAGGIPGLRAALHPAGRELTSP
jgi:urease accessory protein